MVTLGQYKYGDIKKQVEAGKDKEVLPEIDKAELVPLSGAGSSGASLPGTIASSIGQGLLSRIPGYSAYQGRKHAQAVDAAQIGGQFIEEDGKMTLTDSVTGEPIDVSTLDLEANKDLINRLDRQNTLTSEELYSQGLVKILDGDRNVMNSKTVQQDVILEDGTTKTINVHSFSDARAYLANPAKRMELARYNLNKNLDDAGVGENMKTLVMSQIESAYKLKSDKAAFQNLINSNTIKLLDKDTFTVLQGSFSINEQSLAKVRASQPTTTELITTHNKTYNMPDNQDLVKFTFNVKGQSKLLRLDSRFVTSSSYSNIGKKLDKNVDENLGKAGLVNTGKGAMWFYGTTNAAYVGKQGDPGKGVEDIVSGADYASVFIAGESENIRDVSPTDFTDSNWRKNSNTQTKLRLLTSLGFINKDSVAFSNLEEEMEFDAYAITYFDTYFMPQYNEVISKLEKDNPRARNQITEMGKADDVIKKVIMRKRTLVQQSRELSSSGSGKMLLDRQNQLIEAGNFLTGKIPDEGLGLAGELVNLSSDKIETSLRKMDNIEDRLKYVGMLESEGLVTEEAAEFLTDKERYIYANTNKHEREIKELESHLNLSGGGGRYQVVAAKEAVDKSKYNLSPVPINLRFRTSSVKYNSGIGKFEQSLGHPSQYLPATKSDMEDLLHQANFFSRLDNNFKKIRTKHEDVSAEQYLDIVKRRFEEQDKDQVMKTFKLDESTYMLVKNNLEQVSDDDLLEFFVEIQESKLDKLEEEKETYTGLGM